LRRLWIGAVAITFLLALGCSSEVAASFDRDPRAFCESVKVLESFPGFSAPPAEQIGQVAVEYLETAVAALQHSPDELRLSIGAVAQSAQDFADLVEASGGDPAQFGDAEMAEIETAFKVNISPASRWAADNCHEHELADGASLVLQLYEMSSHAPDGIDRDHVTEARVDLYAVDAEIHGHPLSPETIVRGIAAIRELIDREYELGPLWGGAGRFGQVVVLGDTVTWSETRRYEDGSECSFVGNQITATDGQITRHDFGVMTCDA